MCVCVPSYLSFLSMCAQLLQHMCIHKQINYTYVLLCISMPIMHLYVHTGYAVGTPTHHPGNWPGSWAVLAKIAW